MKPAIRRFADAPYRWDIIGAPLSEVANKEKLMHADFISPSGFSITDAVAAIWLRSSLATSFHHASMACRLCEAEERGGAEKTNLNP
jgi:hypothetical protein